MPIAEFALLFSFVPVALARIEVPAPTSAPILAQPAEPQPLEPRDRKVSLVFLETDIQQVLAELGQAVGASLVPDSSVQNQNITIEFKDEPFERALERVALFGGYSWKRREDGVYLVSAATPESPLFLEFAQTARYVPKYQTVKTILKLLSDRFVLYVRGDDERNQLAITAPPNILRRIQADLALIDAPSKLVAVEALFAEITLTDGKETGFSWSWGKFSGSSDLDFRYARASDNDLALLRSLISDGKAELRANPTVLTFEGRQASINVGQETYFSILSGNVSFPTAQIQLISTGVELKFTAFVGDDGQITLDLEPSVSDAVTSVDGNPTTNVRRAKTSLQVRDGETIALGGLVQDVSHRKVDRVPILGDIPLIRELFTRRSVSRAKREVIMLIRPRLGGPAITGLAEIEPKSEPAVQTSEH